MKSIRLTHMLWLLFLGIAVAASDQHPFASETSDRNCSYTCEAETTYKLSGAPACCPRCWWNCLSFARPIRATDAPEVIGTVHVVLTNGKFVPVKATASLKTKRNYILSTLVESLCVDDDIRKLRDVDVHQIEVFGRNVTISTFVPLNVSVGINDTVLEDKVFEIIPQQKSPDKDHVLSDLVLSVNFLQAAGALAINQAVFTKHY